MAEVGAFTLENLTTGMYIESLVIFREYIQNACDAIDKARTEKILAADEGKIEIAIDAAKCRITIADNATGISVLDFKSSLINIAYSDKTLETDRGFRGIGRLCGLAYCRELRFISTARGEGIQSTVIFDAAKLRAIFYSDKKYTVKEALDEIVSFETTVADADEHFFRVELLDIVDTNKDLLDVEKVRDYLSFVSPVTYSAQLSFQSAIYKHAAALGVEITEYEIWLNGEQIVKDYKDNFTTKLGADKIFGLEFRDFYDGDNLIAWSWIGLSEFKGIIQQTKANPNQMRCLRLRQKNIQIGGEKVFQHAKWFGEDRGTNYFVGEVHAVDTNLRPNSRRDYFEENDACKTFENLLRDYFKELSKLYHFASDTRNAFKATAQPQKRKQEIERHTLEYQKTHEAEHDAELAALNKKAAEKQTFIDEKRQEAADNPDALTSRVFEQIAKHNESTPPVIEPGTNNPPPHTVASVALVG